MFRKISSGLKAAAAFSATAAKNVYSDLTALPKTVRCSNPECKLVLVVPEVVWAWTCPHGHRNMSFKTTCDEPNCQGTRAKPEPPVIQCGQCATQTTVPTSNASSYARTAKETTQKAVTDTAEYTKKTYNQLKSRPVTVACSTTECKEPILIPLSTWDWKCKNGHTNNDDEEICTVCGESERLPNQPTPTVRCPTCGIAVKVYKTVAQVQAVQAAAMTKDAAETAQKKAKEAYSHYTAKPEQFNCGTCNTKLNVPPPIDWYCQTRECGKVNQAFVTHCTQCNQKHKAQVRCGSCQQPTVIPDTNLSNAVRRLNLNAKSAYNTAKTSAKFVSEHKEDIAAAGKFAKDNPELAKAAAKAL